MTLWKKNVSPDPAAEKYTAGDDIILDQLLVESDCNASIAHGKMLKKQGFLSAAELKKIIKELKHIIALNKKGKFRIKIKDEDCHTAIESHLTKKLGKLGKKIHFLRSRNDQVLVATRLYTKEKLLAVEKNVKKLISEISKLEKKAKVDMPGYTHTRKAMPHTASGWIDSFASALKDDLKLVKVAYELNDQNPLGSCAGFGSNIDIDREYTAKLLKFGKVQKPELYVQNSRGKIEASVLFALSEIMLTLNRLATDLIMFSSEHFGYIEIPEEFCTGSSIMPQKNNPDVLELCRANCHKMISYLMLEMNISTNLISGYHRDLQLSKEPLLKGLQLAENSTGIMSLLLPKIKFNKKKMGEAMTNEIFAAYEANEFALKGISFRDAYKKVSKKFQK